MGRGDTGTEFADRATGGELRRGRPGCLMQRGSLGKSPVAVAEEEDHHNAAAVVASLNFRGGFGYAACANACSWGWFPKACRVCVTANLDLL